MTGLCHSLAPLAKAKLASTGAIRMEKSSAPEQREGDGPGHGLKQAAFDALQGKDRQVGGDDDGDGIEHRTLHFVRGVADPFGRGFGAVGETHVAHDVFDHDHGAVDHHAEIQRAERKQVGGNAASGRGRWRRTAGKTEWWRRR